LNSLERAGKLEEALNLCRLGRLQESDSADAAGQQRGAVTLEGAFLGAGASQVVATLAAVEDEQAEALFGHFYAALKEGKTPAEAPAGGQS
jgi:CHAT domain-containing protein